jgi:CubicO group peptidase (beta-lactamase class C family)
MRALATALPVTAAIAFAACSHSPAARVEGETCAPAYASVARFVDSTAQRHGASGAALLLVRGDQVLCEHYFGAYGAGRALPAAAASKWMTAVAILALVDGKHLGSRR